MQLHVAVTLKTTELNLMVALEGKSNDQRRHKDSEFKGRPIIVRKLSSRVFGLIWHDSHKQQLDFVNSSIHHTSSPTYMLSSVVSAGNVLVTPGSVGRIVEVQLRLSVRVKLHPSVVSGRGRVISCGEGCITDPRLTQKEATNPDTRPNIPPCWETAHLIT